MLEAWAWDETFHVGYPQLAILVSVDAVLFHHHFLTDFQKPYQDFRENIGTSLVSLWDVMVGGIRRSVRLLPPAQWAQKTFQKQREFFAVHNIVLVDGYPVMQRVGVTDWKVARQLHSKLDLRAPRYVHGKIFEAHSFTFHLTTVLHQISQFLGILIVHLSACEKLRWPPSSGLWATLRRHPGVQASGIFWTFLSSQNQT